MQKTIELPETRRSFTKVILTHETNGNWTPEKGWHGPRHRFGNAYVWASYYNRDLQSYMEMYAEALKDFPNLKPEVCECLSVLESGWSKGFAVLRFPAQPDMKVDGWDNREGRLNDMVIG